MAWNTNPHNDGRQEASQPASRPHHAGDAAHLVRWDAPSGQREQGAVADASAATIDRSATVARTIPGWKAATTVAQPTPEPAQRSGRRLVDGVAGRLSGHT